MARSLIKALGYKDLQFSRKARKLEPKIEDFGSRNSKIKELEDNTKNK